MAADARRLHSHLLPEVQRHIRVRPPSVAEAPPSQQSRTSTFGFRSRSRSDDRRHCRPSPARRRRLLRLPRRLLTDECHRREGEERETGLGGEDEDEEEQGGRIARHRECPGREFREGHRAAARTKTKYNDGGRREGASHRLAPRSAIRAQPI